MDRLLDSLKVAKSQSRLAFYVLIIVLTVFSIVGGYWAYLFLRQFSLAELQAKFPGIPVDKIIYSLVGLVILTILVMLFNSQFNLNIERNTSILDRWLPPYTNFWAPASLSNPRDPFNLAVVSDDFPMTKADVYSFSVEVYIANTRSDDVRGPYRHILHRGSKDIVSYVPNTPGSAPKGQGDLNDGLPKEMNPGIFIDQFTNDIVVFIDTDPTDGGDRAYRESMRITDVPLKKPFHLHFSVHDQTAEIYINCRLAASLLLRGMPRAVPNDWYGRVGFARAAAIIQNLKLWDIDLFAIEIMKLCPKINMPKELTPTGGVPTAKLEFCKK
jgi:energy-coupling factor transporter transmembrane protein EcfT